MLAHRDLGRWEVRAFTLLLAATLAACGGDDGNDDGGPPDETVTHPVGDDVRFLEGPPRVEGTPARPHGVATADGGLFVISDINTDTLVFGTVSADGQAFAARVKVGQGPAHVALSADGARAYSADQLAGSLTTVNVAGATATATLPLGDDGFNLLVSPDGSRVFVTTASGSVRAVNTANNQVLWTGDAGAVANGLAYHAASGTLYVSSRDADRITAFEASSGDVLDTWTVGDQPQRLALSRDGTKLYLASETVGVQELTPASGALRTVSGIEPGAVGLALSPDGAQLYVANPPQGIVQVVDVASFALIRSYVQPTQPRNVAFTPDGRVALVTDEAAGVWFIR